MKRNILLAFIFSFVTILSLLTNNVVAAKPLISNIRNTDVISGCNCTFQLPAQRRSNSKSYIFFAELPEKTAWMNIDSKDTQLRLVSSTGNNNLKKGSRSTQNYRAGNVSVRVDRVITNVCGRNEPGCEVTGYAATITAKKLNRQQTLKVIGDCGC